MLLISKADKFWRTTASFVALFASTYISRQFSSNAPSTPEYPIARVAWLLLGARRHNSKLNPM